MSAIDVRRLRVVRGGEVVLHDVDASIESGRVTGLLGSSGSGKSTLMRAIVGVQFTLAIVFPQLLLCGLIVHASRWRGASRSCLTCCR